MLVKKTVTTLKSLEQYQDAINQIHYYQNIFKDFHDLVFLEALCHLDCGRYTKAKSCLDQYSNRTPSSYLYPTETFITPSAFPQFIQNVENQCIGQENIDLSVCIIARNESKQIGECIKSINEIAKEVIVIDTGSTDQTSFIAKQLGATVYPFTWEHNFSAARNFAIEKAAGKWILFIDGDEILWSESKHQIANLLSHPDADGYRLKIYGFMDQTSSYSNCIITGMCRLFKNNGYRYLGNVMEKIDDSIIHSGHSIQSTDIVIHHRHYLDSSDHIEEKRRLKRSAIEAGLKDHLSMKIFARALETFYQKNSIIALQYFEQYFSLVKSPIPDSFYFYVLCLFNAKQYAKAIEFAIDGVRLFPDYTDLIYLQALSFLMLGKPDTAKPLLQSCIALGECSQDQYTSSYGSESFKAISSLAAIYMQEDNYNEAQSLFLQLISHPISKEIGLDGLVKLFIRKDILSSLPDFLIKQNLWTYDNMLSVSNVCASAQAYEESLQYLRSAYETAKSDTTNCNLTHFLHIYDSLINQFLSHVTPFLLPEK